MSGKARTYGNPNLTFTNGKKTQREKGGANAPPIFFYLTTVFFFGSEMKMDKIKYFQNHNLGDVKRE